MGLTLYRRHLKSCRVHSLNLPARAIRAYMECDCPIWIYGRVGKRVYDRQTTKQTDLAAAEAIRRAYLANAKDEAVHGPRISGCIEKFVASKRGQIADKGVGQYQLLLKRLDEFCMARGVYHMTELTVDLIEDFKLVGLADLADTTKAVQTSKLRGFLSEALRRDWIKEPLAAKIAAHRAVYEQKEPFTDAEVEKILAEALQLTGTTGYSAHPRTLRLLLELILNTGMRIGDALQYDPKLPTRGEFLWIYSFVPQKQSRVRAHRVVEAYLSDKLKTSIDDCEWMSAELPFAYGGHAWGYLGTEVYTRMQTIGKRCGVEDCRPHRLRDTFAVRKLLAGVPIEDVSRLLGHSNIATTQMYYARWTVARKARLERLVAQTIMNPEDNTLRDGN